ncbi:MAG: hypothetical protein M1826_005922 [Phylliscum demangeonii]|nr:MAG: hypothetical protein M1826_005922 [Phylliscum demangeonii]
MAGPSRKRQASAPAEKQPTTATKAAAKEDGSRTKPQLPSVATDAAETQARGDPAAKQASRKRKRTADHDRDEERAPAPAPAPRSPSFPSSPPVPAQRDSPPRRKQKTLAFAEPPSSPPVLHRPEITARASARPPSSSSSLSSLPSPSKWARPATGPPNQRKATPKATRRPAPSPSPSPASDDRRRFVEVLLDGIPGGPVAVAGHVKGHLSVTWAGQVLAGASPALPAVPASDHRYRWVQIRLTGIPGGDVVLAGLVRGSLALAREGEVLRFGRGRGH